MPTLVMEFELLTGRYVAAELTDREAAEWPPHPGRVFMALSATCFETGSDPAEMEALRLLESLDPPTVSCGKPYERTRAKTYVPVNDKPTGGGMLQTAPGMTRSRQERTFPTTVPDCPTFALSWSIEDTNTVAIEALDHLCGELVRVGHSSSLVRASARIDAGNTPRVDPGSHRWQPVARGGDISLRVPSSGSLDALIIDGKREAIDEFVTLGDAIGSARGKRKSELKTEFQSRFGMTYKQNLRAPEPTPASIRSWTAYQHVDDETDSAGTDSPGHMSDQFLVLAKHDGPTYALGDTLLLTRQLRGAMLSACPIQPAPGWLSGHDDVDQPTRLPHVALVPLPFVGSRYADGHLMGLAIVPPKRIAAPEFGRNLGPLLYDADGHSQPVKLTSRRLGDCDFKVEDRDEPAKSLQAISWTRPARVWASVTPVVLDRYPKTDRRGDPAGWRAEVADIVIRSCGYAGIAPPTQVDVDTTAFIGGVPRATQKRSGGQNGRRIGDGFPPYTSNRGKPPRPQVHVRLTFDRPHAGPILVGAGRFMGYGFFRPVYADGGAR